MLPQHDDLEFDADVVSILPPEGTRLPGPVLAWGRQLLANQLIRGDGEAHGAFHLDYGGTQWNALIRQESWGGHKLIFREISCRDRLPAYTAFKSSAVPTGYFGFYRDGTKEEIDPLDGMPRPLGDPATTRKTKGYRLPQNLRAETPRSPIDVLRTASMYTGQMREAVQCVHLRGSQSPFDCTFLRTHGIVEAPHPRVVGGTADAESTNQGQRKFWVVEISTSGVFATRVRGGKRCCDSWLPSWSVKDENGDYSFTPLATKFTEVGQTKVTQLLTAAQIAPAYAVGNVITGLPPAATPTDEWTGWAFSYSGHEAQNVTHHVVAGVVRSSRFRIEFTALAGATPSISAAFDIVENEVANRSFTFVIPRRVVGAFPQVTSVTMSGTLPATWDAPLYVFYTGDTERVLRFVGDSAVTSSPAVLPSVNGAGSPVGTSGPSSQYFCTLSGVYPSPIDGTDGFIGTSGENHLVLTGAFDIGGVEEIGNATSFSSWSMAATCTTVANSATAVCPMPQALQPPTAFCNTLPGSFALSGFIVETQVLNQFSYNRTIASVTHGHIFAITIPYIDREALVVKHTENDSASFTENTHFSSFVQANTAYDTSGVLILDPTCTTVVAATPAGGSVNGPSIVYGGQPTHASCPGLVPSTNSGSSGTGSTFTVRVAVRSETIVVGTSNLPVGSSASHRVIDAPYVMGAGLFYADPTMTPSPSATTKLLLTYDQPFPYTPNFDTLFPAATIVPTGFLKPDIYPGGWIGRI